MVLKIMSNNNNHKIGEAPWLHVIISTGLGTGFVPVAPGTAGAFLALLIWIALFWFCSPTLLLVINILLVIVTLFVGIWTDNVMESFWGEDPRSVVIDEFFGTWIATLAGCCIPNNPTKSIILATIGFALFRIIDITKPLGCRWIDKNIHGGWGCMLDDALAGFYALVIALLIRYSCILEQFV